MDGWVGGDFCNGKLCREALLLVLEGSWDKCFAISVEGWQLTGMYLLQILRGESGLTTERMRKLNVEINAKVVQVLEPSVHCCACTV